MSDRKAKPDYLLPAAASLAVISFFAYLLFNLGDPLPILAWEDGMLRATAARVASGGHFYESPSDSLLDASWPYSPGLPLMVYAAQQVGDPAPITTWPKILGIASLIAFAVGVLVVSVAAGVPWLFATVITVFCLTMVSRQTPFQTAYSFAPDFPVMICALCACMLAVRIRDANLLNMISLLAVTFAAGLFKASGIALFFGLAGFAFLDQGVSNLTRLCLIGLLTGAGVAVAATSFLMPNCLDTTVHAMAQHPKSLLQLFSSTEFTAREMGFYVFLLAAASGSIFVGPVRRAWREIPRALLCLTLIVIPFGVVQIASALKLGGGANNLETLLLLALPIVVAVFYQLVSQSRLLPGLLLMCALAALAFNLLSIKQQYQTIRSNRERLESQVAYLSKRFPHAKVLYSAQEYTLVQQANLEPLTDILTVWHFLSAGIGAPKVAEALDRQTYDLVLYMDHSPWDTPLFAAFREHVATQYEPISDEEMPPSLRGRVWGRRKKD